MATATPTLEQALAEHARRLKSLSDPHLAPIAEVRADRDQIRLVHTRGTARSLSSLLAGHRFTPGQAVAVASGTLAGLTALQRQGLVHGALDEKAIEIGGDGETRLRNYAARPRLGSRGLTWPDPGRDLTATGGLLVRMLDSSGSDEREAPGLRLFATQLAEGRLGRRPDQAQEMLLEAVGALTAPPARARARSDLAALAGGLAPAPGRPAIVQAPPPEVAPGVRTTPRGAILGWVAAGLAAVLLLAGMAALLNAGAQRQTSARPAPPAVRNSAAAVAASPTVASTPVVVATPAPVATSPAAAPPSPGLAADASTPAGAVALFYEAVAAHDFETALQLWSENLQDQYPPDQYLVDRFQGTSSISLRRNQVISQRNDRATVRVDLLEVRGGRTRRWAGTWDLVREDEGWLLDRPHLSTA